MLMSAEFESAFKRVSQPRRFSPRRGQFICKAGHVVEDVITSESLWVPFRKPVSFAFINILPFFFCLFVCLSSIWAKEEKDGKTKV